jgi:hypothetical protein
MDCVKCLEENKKSIEKNGYGYGYIGKENNCKRHKSKNDIISWSNGQPYERSRRLNQLKQNNRLVIN